MQFWESQLELVNFFQFEMSLHIVIPDWYKRLIHFSSSYVLAASFLYIPRTLGNKTANMVTVNYIKHLHAPWCLDIYIYFPVPSGWTLPEQDKDNVDPREVADATHS